MTWEREIALHRDAVQASFGVFRRSPHEALLWVTTVIAVYVVTLGDDVASVALEAVESYHAERRPVYRRSGRISRNPRGWTRWSGCIEIDLIHPNIARLCSRTKSSLLAEFGVDVMSLRPDQQVLVLHEHALVDHRGHSSADALRHDMRAAWPGPRRVHAAELHPTGTVAENIDRLAGYATKFCFRHSVAWNGQKTRYLGDYTREWREYVKNVYTTIGIYRLLNSNAVVQSTRSVERPKMYAEQTDSAAETAGIEPVQLCVPETFSMDKECNQHNLQTDTTASPEDDGDTMRAHEIIDRYVDPTKMSDAVHKEIVDALERSGESMTPALMQAMYGDEREELELEQLRLDLTRTRAEVENLEAEAARDRAATRRELDAADDDRGGTPIVDGYGAADRRCANPLLLSPGL